MISLLKNIILKNILIIKYIIIGGVNTCFGYGVYWSLLQLDFNFAFAALLSSVLGVIFNFFTFGQLVFESKNDTNSF